MTDTSPDSPPTSFHDLDAYVALPRGSGLLLSPDGTRLVTSVATLDPTSTSYVSALWEVDPTGGRPARRLTRSAKGEAGAAFLPDGSLLFVSGRSDPATKDDDDKPVLWLLPAGGGEARVVARRPGGIGGVRVADDGSVLVSSATFPGSTDLGSEERVRKERTDKSVSAILHHRAPVRFWDHDLGPDAPRLFLGRVRPDAEEVVELHDLTPEPGRALEEAEYDLSPDGSLAATSWAVTERGGRRGTLVLVDTATGERRTLAEDPEREYGRPRFSPDGRQVAFIEGMRAQPHEPGDVHLVVAPVDGSAPPRRLTDGWDHWPSGPHRWTPDGHALVVVADEDGRAPVFRIRVDDGAVTRLTADAAAFSDVQVAPDGRTVYAMRRVVRRAGPARAPGRRRPRTSSRPRCGARSTTWRSPAGSRRSRRPPTTAPA